MALGRELAAQKDSSFQRKRLSLHLGRIGSSTTAFFQRGLDASIRCDTEKALCHYHQDLRQADLSEADLSEANLLGVRIDGTEFANANLPEQIREYLCLLAAGEAVRFEQAAYELDGLS